jgi:hypothetical protein
VEEWRPVRGYEDIYTVSRLGNVRSLRSGKLLVFSTAQYYLRVTLSRDGRSGKRKVHQLVAEAFLDPPAQPGMVVAHGPGGHLDNSAANLSYKTQRENLVDDRRRDGTLCGGRKLTEEIVRDSKRRYDGGRGERVAVLAEEAGVALEHMRLVVTGKRWAHVA